MDSNLALHVSMQQLVWGLGATLRGIGGIVRIIPIIQQT